MILNPAFLIDVKSEHKDTDFSCFISKITIILNDKIESTAMGTYKKFIFLWLPTRNEYVEIIPLRTVKIKSKTEILLIIRILSPREIYNIRLNEERTTHINSYRDTQFMRLYNNPFISFVFYWIRRFIYNKLTIKHHSLYNLSCHPLVYFVLCLFAKFLQNGQLK